MIRGNWWEVFNEPELNDLENAAQHQQPEHQSLVPELHGGSRADCRGARTVLADHHREPLLEPIAHPPEICIIRRRPIPARHRHFGRPALTSVWTPDLFGKIRNEVREAQFAAQASAADLELEKLTEQASLAAILL